MAKPWVPDKGIQIGWSNIDDEKQEELQISWMFSLWPGPLRPGPSFTTRLITIYHQRPPSRPQSWWTISTYWNILACLDLQRNYFACGKIQMEMFHSVNAISSVNKDQITQFFVKMMIWFLSAFKSILTLFKEMFLRTSSNCSLMTITALLVFRSNIFFLE